MTQRCESGYFLHPPGKLSRGAVLDVGLKCVHSCKFCYYSYLDKSNDQFRGMRRAEFRTLEQCKEIVRKLKTNGFVNFDVTGGEPTLHPGIIEIIRYAHQDLGLKGRIITLGQYLMRRMKNCKHDKLVDDLLEAGLTNFLFSMHAVAEPLFEKLTGESWEKQRRAMEYLDAKGFQFTTNTTVVEWNYRHLPAIAREILKHGIYLHNFIIMNAYYEWNRDGKAFGVQARYSDIHPYLQEAVGILESADVAVNIRYAPLCAVRGMEKNLVGMVGVRYDPYEWMNVAGHFGGTPEQCAAVIAIPEGGIEAHLQYRDISGVHDNGVRVTGMRGPNLKHFAEPCKRCAARPVCDGIDPNYLKHHGPDEFIPYADPQREPLHKDRYTYLMPFLVKTEQYADMKTVVKEAFAAWRKMAPRITGATSPPRAVAVADGGGRPKVSVVVTCYNYGRYLKEAVGSVLAQTYRDLEIVIVDDGSTDDTCDVIRQIVAANPHACIRVIHQPNSGQPAHSRNRGIREARGEYILCLDADDMIAPTMIERCVAVLDTNPAVAIAYTDRLDFGGVTQLVRAAPYDARRLAYQNHLSYCALYRRKVWEDVGGYRDNVKGCEDWDFWVAACARGYIGFYIPEPLFLYRRHDTGLYQHALANFEQKRAQIVLNNRSLYRPEDIAWAEEVLGGRHDATVPADGHKPLVTVVVPTRDRPRLLEDALASLVAQDYLNWEAIVVNDGGEDVEALVRAIDPAGRIRIVTHRASLGPGAARNTALKLARGEIVCYLDDDDIFRIDHLSTVVAALAPLPRPGFVYTDAEIVQEQLEGGSRRILASRGNPYRHEFFSRERLLVSNYIPINTWAHHWELAERAGFFDERLPVLEDWDFLLKCLRHVTPQHVPRTTVEVRSREAADSVTRRGRPHMAATWREIYARSDDLADEAIRAERDALLSRHAAPEAGDETHAAYRKWVEKHTLEEIDGQLYAERMVLEWKHHPRFHFVTVVSRAEQALLADTLDSLAAQLYRHWRLTILADFPAPADLGDIESLAWVQLESLTTTSEAVNGVLRETDADWVAWIPPGLRAAPQLLLVLADHIHLEPRWRLIYTDSDTLGADGVRRDPCFRPDFNLDLLRSMFYLGELCLVERATLLEQGGYAPLPGAENYDLALKVLDSCGEAAIGHVSDVLYHLPAVGVPVFDERSGKQALEAHLERRGVRAVVGSGLLPGTFRVQYLHDCLPLVSVIVPTRDRLEYLEPCIESLLARTDYAHYEVLVVDNQSEDPDTLAYLKALARRDPQRIRVLRYPHPFNFAAISNMAAREARGEYLLFLNNDTQIVHSEWLARMMQHAQRPEIGIVGARLVFPETGKLQHAGVVLGLDTVAGHPYVGLLHLKDPGYMGRAQVDQNYSAVTGACLLVRRAVYEQVGGMDEERFWTSFNDIDLCLKVAQAGYKIVWTPYATLVHHGHVTQRAVHAESLMKRAQAAERDEQERAAMLDKWLPQIAHDPAYNRHLSLVHHDFRPEADVVINWDPRRHDRPRVLGLSPGGGVGEYRVNAPLRAISRAGLAQTDVVQAPKFHQVRLLTVSEVARAAPDVLVYHSALCDGQLESMRRIRRHLAIPFVYGLDDLVTNVPPKSSSYRYAYKDARARLRRALAMCERLVVTTVPLAELARDMIDEIHVVPNYLERSQWEGLVSLRRQGPKARVGWAGGQQHQGDLELIEEVVEATAREVDWVFLGMCPERLRPYVKEVHGFQPGFRDYLARLASLNLDLAIAPLELHPFNEAKSNLRLLEYGMLGWPVVCTDILPYQGAPVCRVPNEPRRWIEAIRERAHDLDAAAKEGDRLREWVQAHYLLEDHLEEWLAALGLRAVPVAGQATAPQRRAASS